MATNIGEESVYRPVLKRIVRIFAIIFSCFFLYTSFRRPFISIIQRSINVCGGIVIFCLYDMTKKQKKYVQIIDVLIIAVMSVSLVYLVSQGKKILMPSFSMSTPLMYLGIAMIICVLESARRCIGKAVPIISIIALLYALFGQYIPGTFSIMGLRFERWWKYFAIPTEVSLAL